MALPIPTLYMKKTGGYKVAVNPNRNINNGA